MERSEWLLGHQCMHTVIKFFSCDHIWSWVVSYTYVYYTPASLRFLFLLSLFSCSILKSFSVRALIIHIINEWRCLHSLYGVQSLYITIYCYKWYKCPTNIDIPNVISSHWTYLKVHPELLFDPRALPQSTQGLCDKVSPSLLLFSCHFCPSLISKHIPFLFDCHDHVEKNSQFSICTIC